MFVLDYDALIRDEWILEVTKLKFISVKQI